MTTRLISRIALCAALALPSFAQAPAAKAQSKSSIPRMADGKPDLSGVWWRGEDVGGKTGAATKRAPGEAPTSFQALYTPEAQAAAKKFTDKDDPTLRCQPTAFGTLNISMFDVGAIAQIVQTPKFVVMLTETFHGFQVIPTDGRPHRDTIPPSNRGDAVGHWEGDTFVVEKTNFTDSSWISAEGRVSFHSDELRIVERYRRVDANTLTIDATLTDPKVLTKPWIVPTQTLQLAPFDQIMDLVCSGTETQSLMDFAATQNSSKK
jgi:hypothetical protein